MRILERLQYYKKFNENYFDIERITHEMLHVNLQELLTDSCFYYSAGADITPIVECKSHISKYIYCDIAVCSNAHEIIFKLKQRLREKKFIEIQKLNIDARWLGLKDKTYRGEYGLKRQYKAADLLGDFSIWEFRENYFCLLYIVWDNTATWINLFDKHNIKPRAICNYRYECGVDFDYFELREEMKPEIWIGHCHRQDYELIKKIDYYGDYFDFKVDYYEQKKF